MVYNCSVVLYTETSRNEYGEIVWNNGYTYKARVVRMVNRTLNPRGEDVLADLIVHLHIENTVIVEIGQKLVYDDQDYMVVEVNMPKNEVGHIRDIRLLCKQYEQ